MTITGRFKVIDTTENAMIGINGDTPARAVHLRAVEGPEGKKNFAPMFGDVVLYLPDPQDAAMFTADDEYDVALTKAR